MITDQLIAIHHNLSRWAKDEGGIARVASDLNHMWAIGNTDFSTPSIILAYEGESMRGPEETADITARVNRSFQAMITRARSMTADRGEGLIETLTQSKARPFYSLVEEARDIIRNTILAPRPENFSPILINDIKPTSIQGVPLDAYIISFTVITEIPMVQYLPTELGGGSPVNTGFTWR